MLFNFQINLAQTNPVPSYLLQKGGTKYRPLSHYLLMNRLFMDVYLHILEHERILTDSQGLAAGSGHIPENDFPGSDIGKLLLVGIVSHLWIEV